MNNLNNYTKHCDETDWNECCKCNFFNHCDLKEKNQLGLFIVFKNDFLSLLNRLKNKFKKNDNEDELIKITGMRTGKIYFQKKQK